MKEIETWWKHKDFLLADVDFVLKNVGFKIKRRFYHTAERSGQTSRAWAWISAAQVQDCLQQRAALHYRSDFHCVSTVFSLCFHSCSHWFSHWLSLIVLDFHCLLGHAPLPARHRPWSRLRDLHSKQLVGRLGEVRRRQREVRFANISNLEMYVFKWWFVFKNDWNCRFLAVRHGLRFEVTIHTEVRFAIYMMFLWGQNDGFCIRKHFFWVQTDEFVWWIVLMNCLLKQHFK